MKTQILHLEQHDDLNSTRDKMGWGQTTRTLLVWPPGSRILQRRLDLLLLQRHCKSLGSQIALVTDNDEIRYYAAELSIPVFDSIQSAQDGRWIASRRGARRPLPAANDPYDETGGRRTREDLLTQKEAAHPPLPPWSRNPWIRLGIFAAGVAAILAIAGMFVPGAEISIAPARETQEVQFTVQASSAVDTISQAGIVPARDLRVVVEGRGRIPSSGQVLLQNTAAEGSIRFTNLTETEVTVPAGTVVRSGGSQPVRFSTEAAEVVPAGPGESVSIPVTALTRGKLGNLPPGAIEAIEGQLGLSLTATNPLSTHGGTNVVSPAPTEADRQKLYNQLLESLTATAREEIEGLLGEGDFLVTEEPEVVKILAEVYTPDTSEAADNLELHLQAEFQGMAVPTEVIQVLAGSVLDQQLEPEFLPLGALPEIEHLSAPVTSGEGLSSWVVRAERTVVADIDSHRIAQLSLGQPPAAALQILRDTLELEAGPEIQLSPDWWPRLPYLTFRIRVDIADGREAASLDHAGPGR